MKKENLKWAGFIAGIVIFLSIALFLIEELVNSYTNYVIKHELSLFILCYAIFLVPSLISSLLSLYKKFWWLVFFGIIYTFLGITYEMLIKQPEIMESISILGMILGGLILFLIPFVNKIII